MTRIGRQSCALFALVLVAALRPAVARADSDTSIQLDVNPPEVMPGDVASITVTVTNAPNASLKSPPFGELQVVAGPMTSTQTTFVIGSGGQMQQSSVVYTWQVQAPHEGTFRVGPAVVDFQGKRYSSATADLHCSKTASPRPQPRRRGGGLFGMNPFDPFDQFDQMNVRRPVGNNDVFLKTVIDKPEPYLGEQVTMSIYLFAVTDVSGVSSVVIPKLDGFWAEDTEAPTQLTGELKTIDNTVYHVYLLRRRALFPLRAGEITIDAVEAQVNLSIGIDPFGMGGEPVKRKSAIVKVNVKPLPVNGQTADFQSTNVGNFRLSASLTPSVAALGQVMTLRVVLEGTGNIKSVTVPKPDLPDGLKTYDPTVTDKIHVSQQQYGGTKTIDWVVMPQRTGDFVIPPISMPYFNPATQSYMTAHTEPISLHITGPAAGSEQSSSSSPVAAPTATNVLDSGIRPIRLQGDLHAAIRPLSQRVFFWPMLAFPVLLFAFLWGGTAAAEAWRSRDPEQLRVRRAHSAASRRLKAARDKLDANDADGFYGEVTRALQQFVTDKAGVAALGRTRDELGQELADRGFPQAQVRRLVRLLETCETARFSPGSGSSDSMSSAIEQAQSILDALERVRASRAA